MNAERLMALAFPKESKEDARNQGASGQRPHLVAVKTPDPERAWRELQEMLLTIPGLELRTDGQGGVWLREPNDWAHFERAQRLFLEAMPEIEKTLGPAATIRRDGKQAKVTQPMLKVWRRARSWIFAHFEELTAAGWTSRRLFAAGLGRYPHGEWGVAWSSNWIRPGVKINLRGQAITWQWIDGPKTITQTAQP